MNFKLAEGMYNQLLAKLLSITKMYMVRQQFRHGDGEGTARITDLGSSSVPVLSVKHLYCSFHPVQLRHLRSES